MTHFKSNLRDLQFNLFEYGRIQSVLGTGPFAEMDEDTARSVLLEVEKLATGVIADSFEPGDREPLKLEEGDVTLPPSIRAGIDAFYEGGWQALELPPHLGGVGAPPSVRWASLELVCGASPAVAFYLFGTFIATIIDRLGTEAQKERYVRQMLEKRWGGTMVLTEPDAGSDVGAGRSKAVHVEGDVWQIEGTKRFITNGDFDGPDNIVHLVLARPEGAAAGTKGLSLFIVPKFWVEEDGTLGARNGVFVSAIEKKMGLSASATCELTMGDSIPCRGLLVGEVHDGIRQMFRVIEHARMFIGLKSMSTASTGYLNALAYAKERVQGADMKQMADKSAPRVRIIEHPDVRRTLMLQKAHVEGMRALTYWGARIQDDIAAMAADPNHSKAELDELERRSDLLLPLIKGYNSEKAYELLAVSLQTFGGSGYCKDYPIEQYIRDQKIDTLYEGTTHIQALDLVFRKIARDGGATLRGVLGDAQALLKEERGGPAFANERALLAEALGTMQQMLMACMAFMKESIYLIGFNANRMLESLAEVIIAYLLLDQAVLAAKSREGASEADVAFYNGKIASARFFAKEVLPELSVRLRQLKATDLGLMDLDEAAF
ncbi:MAG: acyl-CoA dehydrogenase [Sandaracinaceae bacterium]|nr:acyl-CoA dehydrogenase [Sandaracinaceae bacterium]